MKGNENKRLYPVFPFPEDRGKKNPLTVEMLLTLLTYVLCRSQTQGEIYNVLTHFSSMGTAGKPISTGFSLSRVVYAC